MKTYALQTNKHIDLKRAISDSDDNGRATNNVYTI